MMKSLKREDREFDVYVKVEYGEVDDQRGILRLSVKDREGNIINRNRLTFYTGGREVVVKRVQTQHLRSD